eukprot:GFKZ01012402.1.p1 GENE.GFKZ01012402.1~~GFKZ01012402.1.p1  ORF type:complete len:296 (-),score=38.47 GFKZ01012402.1:963-1850(-)
MSLPDGVNRSSIPFFAKDVVTVSNPEILRKLATSPDIGRPGDVPVPWIFMEFFRASKFLYPTTGQIFIALEGDDTNNRLQRRNVVSETLASGLTEEHISKLVELIKGDGDKFEVGAECSKIIGDVILPLKDGQRVPDDVALASCNTALFISVLANPFATLRARHARRKVEEYLEELMPEETNIGDFAHNLGAAAQGFAAALLSMRNMETEDVMEHFLSNPISETSMRRPLTTTTLGGIFPEEAPLTRDSVIVMRIADGVRKSRDGIFLFGSGSEERQCPFKPLFFKTTAEIKDRL